MKLVPLWTARISCDSNRPQFETHLTLPVLSTVLQPKLKVERQAPPKFYIPPTGRKVIGNVSCVALPIVRVKAHHD